jgi:mediator of RNA polymerase II transcription subunit 22
LKYLIGLIIVNGGSIILGFILPGFQVLFNVFQVHSADSVLKLVSELKRTAIFSGLASLSENVDRRIEVLNQQAEGTDRILERIGQEAAASLKELEAHYYSSVVRTPLYD